MSTHHNDSKVFKRQIRCAGCGKLFSHHSVQLLRYCDSCAKHEERYKHYKRKVKAG